MSDEFDPSLMCDFEITEQAAPSFPGERRCVCEKGHEGKHVVGFADTIHVQLLEVDEEAQTFTQVARATLTEGPVWGWPEMCALAAIMDAAGRHVSS